MGKNCIRIQRLDEIEWSAGAEGIAIDPDAFAKTAIAEREAAFGKG